MLTIYLELICTVYLTGLIWTIQRVHYPSFKYIDQDQYIDFQRFHMKKITYVVGPVMLFEFAFSIYNLVTTNYSSIFIFNLAIIILIWASTSLWTVPIHKKLMIKKELTNIDELIKSNLIRSILWTLKTALLLYYLLQLK